MDMTILGTGNAMVTQCYNTCFLLEDKGESFLVDGGGGSGILRQFQAAQKDWNRVHTLFVTHKHVDHLLGILWAMRVICQNMQRGEYEGDCVLYAHDEVISILSTLAPQLLEGKSAGMIGKRFHLAEVKDGESRKILGKKTTFFDIRSTKAKQFGFTMAYGRGKKLTCCGDEPYQPHERSYVENATWLLHEAFCLVSQAEEFHPYEKHHSTVADACALARELGVKNLLLYHTEDKNLPRRKELYGAEGAEFFAGNLYIPNDLEQFKL